MNQMLHKPRPLSLYLGQFICQRCILRQLSTKPTGPHIEKDGVGQTIHSLNELQEEKIYFHKSRGQHILTNQRILDSIVQKSNIKPNDTVLEIGPGTGNLTLKLLEVAKRVFAIEIDKRMVNVLNKRVAEHGFQDQLTVICNDALKTEFPQFDLVVANIPYEISSPLVTRLVYGARAKPFRSATLLLQKEFAKRLMASPGDSEFNRLAVNVKLVADVEFVMDVSKRDFVPCPKVDSSIVIIRPKAEIPDVNINEWWAFTRSCFNKKNKTLGAMFKQKKKVIELLKLSRKMGSESENVLNDNHYDHTQDDDDDYNDKENDLEDCYSSSCLVNEITSFKERIIRVLKSEGFEDKRPSKLSNEELIHLLARFNQDGIYFHDLKNCKKAENIDLSAACNL